MVFTAVAGGLLLAGCGQEAVPSDRATVKGTVTMNDQPVPEATVIFNAADGGPSAVGRTDDRGRFTLSAGPTPGIEPGNYRVTVSKTEAEAAEAVPHDHPDYDGGASAGAAKVEHLLPEKFANPQDTPLEATVTEGSNDVELDLEA